MGIGNEMKSEVPWCAHILLQFRADSFETSCDSLHN